MGKMKDIFIDTMNEVENLTDVELRILIREKNKKLGIVDEELLEMMNNTQLVNLVGEKNILLASLKK